MNQLSFKNDYSEGAHQRILNAMMEANLVQEDGYGEDSFCVEATRLILKKMGNANSDIHFVSGGTQANMIVISSILKPYESVIAATTAHIAVHEAGAIEATGHKINLVETLDGKLNPQNIQPILEAHVDEHMVKPRLVFISNSTEIGGVYSKEELHELYAFCQKKSLYLYLDGARLGSALSALQSNLSLSDLGKLVDVFYIGGTKNGALLGEAIVINRDELKEYFRFHLKQKGALLAKGRVFGIQFKELFKDDLFFEIGKHANLMANRLATGIKDRGYQFMEEPVTNQIFPILPNELIEKLSKKYGFYVWKKMDDKESVLRLVTSWATQEASVDSFIADLE